MRMGSALLSRSPEESQAYLRLVPCRCGETEFHSFPTVWRDGEQRLKQYAGPCARCGTPRQFVFAEAELPVPASTDRVVFGRDGSVSTLLDPGQWLALANRAARAVTSDIDETQARTAMAYAVAALEEVLHFLPPNAGDFDSVPEACFVSALGRGVLLREPPGTFRKARLMARLAAYRRLCGRLRRSNPEGPPSSPAPTSSPAIAATPIPLPSCLLIVDRENKTLSFPTFVLGAGAEAFIAAVRAQSAVSGVKMPPEPSRDTAGGTVTWSPVPLGVIRGFTVVIHLYALADDPSLLPLLAAEIEHVRGIVITDAADKPSARTAAPSSESQQVLLFPLVKSLQQSPRPVVLLGSAALAQNWYTLGGPKETAQLEVATARTNAQASIGTAQALAAFRAIGKAMLLAL